MAEENKNNNKHRHRPRHHRRRHHKENTNSPEVLVEEVVATEELEDEVIEAVEDTEAETVSEPVDDGTPKVEVVGINFREAGKIYYFAPGEFKLECGTKVIVETSRGVEIGTVKIGNKNVPETEVIPPLKAITRVATEEDIERDERNQELELDAAVICKKKIKNHGLDMSLVEAEYTFDNSKLTFYFTCETRVDFRELVKDLASTFHTRIELRQIGIRDEAKLMGGLGICGRKYCCAGFLQDFVQVSIKMAKEQNFSLNSAKVSGACGRLMCCLKYEHEVYEEATRALPPLGSIVKTVDGEGTVVELKVLAGEVKVKLKDNEKDQPKFYRVGDIKVLRLGKKQNGQKNNDDVSDEAVEE